MKIFGPTDQSWIGYEVARKRKMRKTERGIRASGTGSKFTIFESPNKLAFYFTNYFAVDNKFQSGPTTKFILLKRGDSWQLISISINGNRDVSVKNSSNNPSNLLVKIRMKSKGAEKQTKIILRRFAKEQGIKLNVPARAGLDRYLLCFIYPAFNDLCKHTWEHLPVVLSPCYSKYFRRATFQDALKGIFGFNSKRLRKFIYPTTNNIGCFNYWMLGVFLKKLVPPDYLWEILTNYKAGVLFYSISAKKVKLYRDILKHYSSKRILNLFKGDIHWTNIIDTVNMYEPLKANNVPNLLPESPASLDYIHDHLIRVSGRQKFEPAQKIELVAPHHLKDLDKQVVGVFRFEIPTNSDQLQEYSNIMNNCIWSYAARVNEHYGVMGVYKNDILAYNIEVRKKEILQFKGRRNSVPPEEDKKAILEYLKEKAGLEEWVYDLDRGVPIVARVELPAAHPDEVFF